MRLTFLLVACLWGVPAIAQQADHRLRPDSLQDRQVSLNLFNLNFLRNYEFFNQFQDGYTLFGSQIQPQVVFQANPKVLFSAGLHFRKDFGTSEIDTVIPVFSLKYSADNFTLVAGTLEDEESHRLPDVLMDPDREILDPVQYGFQALLQKPNLFIDGFLNWRQMIYRSSPFQEKIMAGITFDQTLFRAGDLRLQLPGAITAFHRGGQIDTSKDPMQTILNGSLGLNLSLNSGPGFIRGYALKPELFWFKDQSPVAESHFIEGTGMRSTLSMDTRAGSLSVSYWKGNQFVSPFGMAIYQSVSRHMDYPGFTSASRSILHFKYRLQRQLSPELYIDFRFEPYFDLKRSYKMDSMQSLYLTFNPNIRVKKIK